MTRAGKLIVHAAVVVALMGALAAWWWLRGPGEAVPGEDAAPASAQPAAPAAATEDADDTAPQPAPSGRDGSSRSDQPPRATGDDAADAALPPLDESDVVVRMWLQERAPSVWVAWRARDDLLRLAAVLLEYAARGQVPRRSLAFVAVGRFEVREEASTGATTGLRDERIFMAPRSYARYDAIVDRALGLPPEDAAMLFIGFEPLLNAALGELGAPAPDARAMLRRAVDHVLGTPVLTGPVELVRPKVYYQFADPALEALAPLQKQLLRTGPDNLRKVRAYAGRLREALNAR